MAAFGIFVRCGRPSSRGKSRALLLRLSRSTSPRAMTLPSRTRCCVADLKRNWTGTLITASASLSGCGRRAGGGSWRTNTIHSRIKMKGSELDRLLDSARSAEVRSPPQMVWSPPLGRSFGCVLPRPESGARSSCCLRHLPEAHPEARSIKARKVATSDLNAARPLLVPDIHVRGRRSSNFLSIWT